MKFNLGIVSRRSGSGSGGSRSPRQVMVPGYALPTYVATSQGADKQYATPGGAFLNEQG